MNSISILIPVYNWDCQSLVTELHAQGLALGVPFEIIVADDCSDQVHDNERMAGELEFCRYIGLDRNIGRSAIRNLLADESRYDKLLFLDCDMQVVSDSFLKDYLEASDRATVVCGGICTPAVMPDGCQLRFRYESQADKRRSAEIRNRQPYSQFTTAAFLIDREEFMKIRFDESIEGYGYEDVRFGHALEAGEITIVHMDNPIIHMGLDSNAVFLEKTLRALDNAYAHAGELGNSSRIIMDYRKVCRLHVKWVFRLVWNCAGCTIRRNLLGNKPNLRLFSLYKLCYLCSEY